MKHKVKPDAIVVDIHHTLLNNNGTVNKNLVNMVSLLANMYQICLITASYYSHKSILRDELIPLNTSLNIEYLYFNHDLNNKNDVDIKEHIYTNQIEPRFNVIGIIDNNKKVTKMFHKLGIDTFRFKSA